MENSFLKKLVSNKIISLVDSSEEISESYLLKSKQSLLSSKTLYGVGHYNDAVALVYYSMYYSLISLLFKCGIKSENHNGSILLLKELFKIDSSSIELAKKERIEKQYYVDDDAMKEDVFLGIESAQEFNAVLEKEINLMSNAELIKLRFLFVKQFEK